MVIPRYSGSHAIEDAFRIAPNRAADDDELHGVYAALSAFHAGNHGLMAL